MNKKKFGWGMFLVIMLVWLMALSFFEAYAATPVYMLMEAPSISDMDVENNAVQINGAGSYADCLEMMTTYTEDKHYWCELLIHIEPYDLGLAINKYRNNQ